MSPFQQKEEKIISRKQKLAKKELGNHYVQTLENDPDHFNHYWRNPQTQVVAFGFDWEIAGQSEEEIWATKLSPDQKKQVFFWVHPPKPDEEEDFVNCVSAIPA